MQNGTAQHYEKLNNKEISNHHIDGTPGQGALDVWKMGGGAIGIWGGSSYFDSFKTIYNGNTTDGHGGAINIGRVNFSDGNYFYTSASASVSKAEFTNNSGSRGGAVINNSTSNFLSESNLFKGNAAASGGAIFNGALSNNSDEVALNEKETLLTLKGTNNFEGNTANNWGGAIVNQDAIIRDTVASKNSFHGNSVTNDRYGLGGALVNITQYKSTANSIVEFIGTVKEAL